MPEPVTIAAIAATWKLLGSLYEKGAAWLAHQKRTKEAERLKTRAAELMQKINREILGGSSSDDPHIKPLVREFMELVANGSAPPESSTTEAWINRSSNASARRAPTKKAAANKAPVKKVAAKQKLPKKPVAKKSVSTPRSAPRAKRASGARA